MGDILYCAEYETTSSDLALPGHLPQRGRWIWLKMLAFFVKDG